MSRRSSAPRRFRHCERCGKTCQTPIDSPAFCRSCRKLILISAKTTSAQANARKVKPTKVIPVQAEKIVEWWGRK